MFIDTTKASGPCLLILKLGSAVRQPVWKSKRVGRKEGQGGTRRSLFLSVPSMKAEAIMKLTVCLDFRIQKDFEY